MYTYFIVANEFEIARMKSHDDVLTHVEQSEPMLGGNVSLEAIASLSKLFLQGEAREPVPTQYSWPNGSRFYIVDAELCEKMASATHESLLDASVSWSEDEPWKHSGVNRMDLAGFILDMAALCKQAAAEMCLFILLAHED
jgi:hypothetical protein